ncbi:MAG: chemotaxis protein CheX [Bdellovibrionales bacterium]|nr:chemotaxis protein CheX [Bdellovibrionales bacterium]
MGKQETFQESIVSSAACFAAAAARGMEALFSVKASAGGAEFRESGIGSERNLVFSILFTGTVYGEFILAMDEETALGIAAASGGGAGPREQALQEAVDGLSEMLNIAVGESVLGLSRRYKKLTITAPKVHFGRVRYPRVKCARAALTSPAGEIDCYLYVDRMQLDISASYKQALKALLGANKDLRAAMTKLEEQQNHLILSEKMAALGMMAAGVAHEINTPLSTILLLDHQMKDLVREENADKATIIDMLGMIETTITRVSKITNALRAYARDSAKEPFETVSVRRLVDEALLLCAAQLKDAGVSVASEGIPESLAIECRIHELPQVLLNLLTNSCDAIRALEKKWIRIEAADHGDEVMISVTDSGGGIPEAILRKVFDPFFTTKAQGEGTGLGLSFSKGIVDGHHGRISVNPAAGNTQFLIRLPKLQPGSVGRKTA